MILLSCVWCLLWCLLSGFKVSMWIPCSHLGVQPLQFVPSGDGVWPIPQVN